MKITVLCENQVGYKGARTCLAEWGLSLLIEINGKTILFDTGHSDIYWKNSEKLGINLQECDYVLLSHHHWDHAGGLRYHKFNNKKQLIIHPDLLGKMPEDQAQKIKDDFDIIATDKQLEFIPDLYFLGQIPRTSTFESGSHKGYSMFDDSAIAVKSKKGVIVITGCSHSGICNICQWAKEVTGQKLFAVLGGFHLFEKDPKAVEGTIEYFKNEKPESLYPLHCVDFPVQARFYNLFETTKLSTGDILEIGD